MLESLNLKQHKPVWIVKTLNIFQESLNYGKYLFDFQKTKTDSETALAFHIWLTEKGYFDFTKIADIKKDVVNVYSGPFNFFCYGTEQDFRNVLNICPMLDGEMRHFLFSTVRVWSTINAEDQKVLKGILEILNEVQSASTIELVKFFQRFRDINRLASDIDPMVFYSFSNFISKHEMEKVEYRTSEIKNIMINEVFAKIGKLKYNKPDEDRSNDNFAEYFSNIEAVDHICDGMVKPFLVYRGCNDKFHVNFYVEDPNYVKRRSKTHFASILDYLAKNPNSDISEKITLVKRNETIVFRLTETTRSEVPAIDKKGKYFMSGVNIEIKILHAE